MSLRLDVVIHSPFRAPCQAFSTLSNDNYTAHCFSAGAFCGDELEMSSGDTSCGCSRAQQSESSNPLPQFFWNPPLDISCQCESEAPGKLVHGHRWRSRRVCFETRGPWVPFLEAGNIHALIHTSVHAASVFMQRLCPCTHWQNHIALVAARASYFVGGCIIEREAVAALAV